MNKKTKLVCWTAVITTLLLTVIIVIFGIKARKNDIIYKVDYESPAALLEDIENGIDVKDSTIAFTVRKITYAESQKCYIICPNEFDIYFVSTAKPEAKRGEIIYGSLTSNIDCLGITMMGMKELNAKTLEEKK